METIVKFPCKECIIKVVCNEICELLKEMDAEYIQNNLSKSICPDCGTRLKLSPILIFKENKIGYLKCSSCDHRFKYIILNQNREFIERMMS